MILGFCKLHNIYFILEIYEIFFNFQLRDNADLESQKLRKDIELADIQLETARLDLARKHNI